MVMSLRNGRMTHVAFMCAASVACIICTGCDIEMPSLRTATEKVAEYSEQQMPKDSSPPSDSHVKGARAELEHFVTSRLKIIDADIVQTEKDLSLVLADRRLMSKCVAELSDKVFSDKTAEREDALLAMLKDETLNVLAAKYLGSDFSLERNGFIAKIRDAYDREKRKAEAIAANKEMFSKTIAGLDSKDVQAENERRSQINSLKKQMGEKERQMRWLRASTMESMQSRRDRDRKISVLEREIDGLRGRISRLHSQSPDSSSFVRNQALMRLESANKEVEKKFNGDVTAFQVADECEKATLKKLEAETAKKERSLRDRQYLLGRQKLFISSFVSGVETLNINALKTVREDIEKVLAWSVEDARRESANGGN